MKASTIFLPFWNIVAALIVFELFLEGLKQLGLVKTNKK